MSSPTPTLSTGSWTRSHRFYRNVESSKTHQGAEVDVLSFPAPVLSSYLQTLRLAKNIDDAETISDQRQTIFSQLVDYAQNDVCHNAKLLALCSMPRDDLTSSEAHEVGQFCSKIVAGKRLQPAEGPVLRFFTMGDAPARKTTYDTPHCMLRMKKMAAEHCQAELELLQKSVYTGEAPFYLPGMPSLNPDTTVEETLTKFRNCVGRLRHGNAARYPINDLGFVNVASKEAINIGRGYQLSQRDRSNLNPIQGAGPLNDLISELPHGSLFGHQILFDFRRETNVKNERDFPKPIYPIDMSRPQNSSESE